MDSMDPNDNYYCCYKQTDNAHKQMNFFLTF